MKLCEITYKNTKYYGYLKSYENNIVEFVSIPSNKTIKLNLVGEYCIQYEEDSEDSPIRRKINLFEKVDSSNLAKEQKLFIKNSEDPFTLYKILLSLSLLKITENDLSIDIIKRRIKEAIQIELSETLLLIDEDEDLNEEEKTILKKDFYDIRDEFYQNVDDNTLEHISKNIPTLFQSGALLYFDSLVDYLNSKILST